ncbi:syntaxin [Trifolium repens]|nr:syntaxin [Trifolium repens]
MATRNRTLEFRKHRDTVKSLRTPLSSSASASSGGPVIEMVNTSLLRSNNRSSYTPLSIQDPGPSSSSDAFTVGLPPSWVDDSEEIATNIQRAKVKMSELTKAHAKALMPSFGDGKDDQHQIETLTREITALLRKSEVRLKKLSSGKGSSEESNVKKNVQRSLATDLQNLSMDLRRKQSAYLKRLQQQQEGYDGIDLEMNFNGSKSGLQDDGFDDVGFSEAQLTKLKKNEQISAEREREIDQVAKSVQDLAQIMKDLSVLVIDQGTIVDRIDYNIQSVATTVEEGFKQLQKAERTQKKGGMITCATVLVIMCFVMLVLLILKEIIF